MVDLIFFSAVTKSINDFIWQCFNFFHVVVVALSIKRYVITKKNSRILNNRCVRTNQDQVLSLLLYISPCQTSV